MNDNVSHFSATLVYSLCVCVCVCVCFSFSLSLSLPPALFFSLSEPDIACPLEQSSHRTHLETSGLTLGNPTSCCFSINCGYHPTRVRMLNSHDESPGPSLSCGNSQYQVTFKPPHIDYTQSLFLPHLSMGGPTTP